MSIIANSSVDKVKFDSTIECTIIDATDKLIGKYKVKNESYAEFYAYSQITTYNKGDKVYVQIPKGDYNSTKFIVGKKTDKNEDKPYNFVNPFNTFIDLTGNFFIAKDNNKEIWSILANGNEEGIEITPNGGITFTDEQQGFTRLGLRADFRAWLETLGVVSGNYGLKIEINGYRNNTSQNIKKEETTDTITLDVSDMYGNPYNFEGYYSQEIIIDISGIAEIKNIKIYLYQNNNFKDESNNLITYNTFSNLSVPPNNIFVKDIYMGLGIATDEVENEYVRLYSLDGSTYVIKSDGKMDAKKITLKWVHFNDNNEKEQITKLPEGCNIYWYQYEFGAPSADEYSGVYWRKLNNDNNFTYELIPRSNKAQEQLKVIILYNNKVYRSNIIIFNNEKEVPNDATIDSLNALSLICKDNSNGNYLIYNQANYLSNRSDGKIERELTLHFNSKTYNIDSDFTNTESILVEAQKVVWYIPTNSMLSFNGYNTKDITDNYLIVEKDNPKIEDFTLTYTIGSFYSANKSNNTVIAKITKDNIEYTAIKTFTFGQAGTNGTDCTLVIDMIGNEKVDNKVLTAIRSGTPDVYEFRAQLYDNQGKEITNFSDNVSWAWSLNKTFSNVCIEDKDKQNCKLRVSTFSSLMDNLIILSVLVKGWGDYDLQAFYPIPITTLENAYINGTTEVIYLSDGSPVFNKEFYALYQNGKRKENITWSIIPTTNTAFIGTINNKNNEYRLSPLSFYVKGADQYGVQAKVDNEIVWTQPILVLQNKYPSAMVNKWDGKALLDSENNFLGVAQIAAGRKDDKNTFTGVLIGDYGGNADLSLSKNTGVYGYYQGKQVYALKDDGTATFGKSGNGQIEIKGDSGKIKSAGYDDGNGLLIDLKNNLIDGKRNDESVFQLSQQEPFLQINTPKTKDNPTPVTLLSVGTSTYYLQSKNYGTTDSNGKILGTFFDLQSGEIVTNSITVNYGTFKDDITINYVGNTGSHWDAGSYTLNQILNKIGTAAYDAGTAAGDATHALTGILDTVDMLKSLFEITASFDKTTGKINWAGRPSFVGGNGAKVSVDRGVEILGDEINIGYKDGGSKINFHSATIYITGTTTLEDYIKRIAGVG